MFTYYCNRLKSIPLLYPIITILYYFYYDTIASFPINTLFYYYYYYYPSHVQLKPVITNKETGIGVLLVINTFFFSIVSVYHFSFILFYSIINDSNFE
jgi:hypothetical protein